MILTVRNLAAAINNTDYIVNYIQYHNKYIVYVYRNGKKQYVRFFRNDKYYFIDNISFAGKFTEDKAVEHLNRITDRIKHYESL